uniref:Uncharacterized protein n=1 Tax=Oryza sativa subsp. japonica TaxID=39947 RepID=Q8H3Q4_ORYSJ|nr:hypothetical protein [Oryza sativa Japonica Group]
MAPSDGACVVGGDGAMCGGEQRAPNGAWRWLDLPARTAAPSSVTIGGGGGSNGGTTDGNGGWRMAG